MFNGAVGPTAAAHSDGLTVGTKGVSAVALSPDNLFTLPKEVVFVTANSAADAEVALLAMVGDNKTAVVTALLKGAKVSTVKDPSAAV
jgi:hypothetical protein